ncbi:MAG TPA: 50S ribosomal protein L32 [Candidatus Absconditabacterales bacterium]|nr:50S ribosomal protein L32 [Candidatus Absconditabacterales bacterium]HNG96713.1 50S ribosomal protein L32 [Candidatus Absconditabacterales bacterium]
MLAPKKKISLFRKRRRHSTWQTLNLKRLCKTYQFVSCSNCKAPVYSHRVCASCGYYNGKQVLTIKVKSKSKIIDA